jgi:signal transduction histidine kinase
MRYCLGRSRFQSGNTGSIQFASPAKVEAASSSSQRAASSGGTSVEIKASSLTAAISNSLSIAIVTIAFAIFVVDTQVDVDIDIPVLYVAVVLMSIRLYQVRGVLIVSVGCAVLTLAGYWLSPGDLTGTTAVANRFLALLAIGATTFLGLRNRSAQMALHKAQTELAHAMRITTLGELTASIAHEVNQPLAGVVANADACLRWLDRGTPDLEAARRSVESIIDDGNRASEVIRRVRALANKTDIEKVPLDVNDVVREIIPLVQRELISHQVSLRTELAPTLPKILGDRVQLQQVIINLVINGIEAMQSVMVLPRELVIRSAQDETQQVLVSVTDCGVGISAENAGRLFNAFFTTKSSGMGMGLSICRSIVEAHGGRLSVSGNVGPGASFQFVLPAQRRAAS